MGKENKKVSGREAAREALKEEAQKWNGCECMTWARAHATVLLTNHHPKCPHCKPEEEARAVIEALVKGMENWAADEDGIHPEAWEAYKRGKVMVGQFDWKEEAEG